MLFDEGQTYYFIVPTKGEDISDIESTTGGLCKTHNLRILIHVLKGNIKILLTVFNNSNYLRCPKARAHHLYIYHFIDIHPP